RPEPGPLGLRRALAEYVSQFGDRAGVTTSFEATGPAATGAELPPVAEVQLLRIVQEALANVRKHAHASCVAVQFWYDAHAWHVSVEDDGAGFEAAETAAAERGRHLGLQIMRERAESIGGSIEVISAPGSGTRIHASVPSGSGSRGRAVG